MIHFVGAGSGAADLITLRGKKLLEEADVVIYAGSLVNPQLLEYTKIGCEIFDSSQMHLEEIIAKMKQAERSGKTTVRLHTGDPCIYGAIREQMDRLDALDISYDICPGVSSFCGAAASLQAEYTLPGVSQSVIITRMAGRTPVRQQESIRELASHQATMVIFLSAGLIPELTQELLAGGYCQDTCAAIVYKATWEDEKIVRCSLGKLTEAARESGITRMALIMVGNFLGDDYELSRLYDAEFTTGYRKGLRGLE